MELRHLRHFVVVAEELHFGRAAKRLSIAQPPLSQSIRRLEHHLDVMLFDRSKHGVALTLAGTVFLAEARKTLQQAEQAKAAVKSAALGEQVVRVSYIPPALYRLLPNLLVSFFHDCPEISVRLHEHQPIEQMTGLARGDFDVSLVPAYFDLASDAKSTVVERSPVIAAVPSGWPIAKQNSVTMAELGALPLILPPRANAPNLSAGAAAQFASLGVTPRIVHETVHTSAALSLVSVGAGVSMVMATAAFSPYRNITYLPFSDRESKPPWDLAMVWRPESLTAPAEAFVQAAMAHAEQHLSFEFRGKVVA